MEKGKKWGINPTSGRGNYVSVSDEVKFAIYYLTKKDIEKVMVQGSEDIVGYNGSLQHLIQVKETSSAYMLYSNPEISSALKKLNTKDDSNVEALVIISNVNIVPKASARVLEDEKFTSEINKAIPNFNDHLACVSPLINTEKLEFHMVDKRNIDNIIENQIANLIEKKHKLKSVYFDKTKAYNDTQTYLLKKGTKLVDEKSAEKLNDQFVTRNEIVKIGMSSLSTSEVRELISSKKDLTMSQRIDYSKKIQNDYATLVIDMEFGLKKMNFIEKHANKKYEEISKEEKAEFYDSIFQINTEDENYKEVFVDFLDGIGDLSEEY